MCGITAAYHKGWFIYFSYKILILKWKKSLIFVLLCSSSSNQQDDIKSKTQKPEMIKLNADDHWNFM